MRSARKRPVADVALRDYKTLVSYTVLVMVAVFATLILVPVMLTLLMRYIFTNSALIVGFSGLALPVVFAAWTVYDVFNNGEVGDPAPGGLLLGGISMGAISALITCLISLATIRLFNSHKRGNVS